MRARMNRTFCIVLSTLIACALVGQHSLIVRADELGQQVDEPAIEEVSGAVEESEQQDGDPMSSEEGLAEVSEEETPQAQPTDGPAGEESAPEEPLSTAPDMSDDDPIDPSLITAAPFDETTADGDLPEVLTSSALLPFPERPIDDNVWALKSEKAICYLVFDTDGRTLVKKYDVATGTVTTVAKLPTSNTAYYVDGLMVYETYQYFVGDTLYYADCKYQTGVGWNATLYAVDLKSCKTSELFTSKVKTNIRNIGVDDQGRIFVNAFGTIYVFNRQGKQLALIEDGPSIANFIGFDSENGNIYYQGSATWTHWGYDHYMEALKVANFDGKNLFTTGKEITLFYQTGWYAHSGCAQLFDGRYLADLTICVGDSLVILDSHAINYKDITDTTTIINPDGTTVVSIANVPASTMLLRTHTHSSVYDNYMDITGVGPRCTYLSPDGVVVVATKQQQATCYRLSDKKPYGTILTTHGIYKLMSYGSELVALERSENGSLYVESFSTKEATAITVQGPSSLKIGASADYTTTNTTTSDVKPIVSFQSSDPTVLSIDADGRAATWREGKATITATTASGIRATKTVTVKGGGVSKSLPDVTTLLGEVHDNWNLNNYSMWSWVVRSYLAQTSSGLMRVQSHDSKVLVEYYNASGTVTSTKSIDNELPIFGGFFAGTNAYYLVFAQENPNESDSRTVLRVVKYSTSWKKSKVCNIAAINTTIPMRAGSLRMAEANGRLYVYTCHEMYNGHQANMTFAIDETSMTVVDSFTGVQDLSAGYVSHSFNQFVRTDGQFLYRVDHGDATPRGIAFTATPLSGTLDSPSVYLNVQDYVNDYGYGNNYTGASVGGFEVSDTSAIIAYNEESLGDTYGARNIFVCARLLTGEGVTVKQQLTSYAAGSAVTCFTPQLAKVDGRHFILMWTEFDFNNETYALKFAQVDHSGQVIGEPVRKVLPVSDCQPIALADGSIAWYVSSGSSTKLYTLNPYSLDAMSSDNFEDKLLLNLKNAKVGTIADQEYTGKAITPSPTITYESTKLVKGVDYDLSYKNNVNEGTATVIVTGKGSYGGTISKEFTIFKNVPVDMHRLYNPNSGEHFYTASTVERDALKKLGWIYEGVGWTAPTKSKTPVYRLYNKYAGDHHYTMSKQERDALKAAGWIDEGIGWYSDDAKGVPLYRQYNPNAISGSHNYTTSKQENDKLVSLGWKEEGIGWYGLKV